jgi:hypothetical protein
MKTATNIFTVAALLALAFFASGAASFFAGCGLFFFALGQAMDFYAVEQEKKNELPNTPGEIQNASVPPPADTSPATVSNGSATDGIQTGKGYVRHDEQAQSGDYTDVNAPADTVKIANVDAPAKPLPDIQLEVI